MKKIIILAIILFIFITGFNLFSSIIKDVYISHNYVGMKAKITWTKIGPMINGVSINLYKSRKNHPIHEISSGTVNDGEFLFNIPTHIRKCEYFIRVETLDKEVKGDSGKFIISGGEPCLSLHKTTGTPLIQNKHKYNLHDKFYKTVKIKSPGNYSKWTTGKSYLIEWKPELKKPITIHLYSPDKKNIIRLVLSKKKSSTLPVPYQYLWTIPYNLNSGMYRIRVTNDEKVSGFSDVFVIMKSQAKPTRK